LVVDPFGDTVSWTNTSVASGGILDFDMNDCDKTSSCIDNNNTNSTQSILLGKLNS
jgi:hypothetical protein